jgi:hypothetical protein
MNKVAISIICLAIILFALFYFNPGFKDGSKNKPAAAPIATPPSSDAENFATWQEFIPQSKLFKVLLPHPPQYAKDLISVPNSDIKRRYDMYASEKIDGTLFLISVITYPEDVDTSFPNDILKQTVDELMKNNPDNRLTKLKDNFFKDHQGTDFSIENREFHVEGKAMMLGKRLYLLSYVTRLNDFDPIEFQHFVDSFELLNRNSEKN